MKKLTFLLFLALMANIISAQTQQRLNAYNFNRYADASIKDSELFRTQNRVEKADKEMKNAKGYIAKAKEAIDLATKHESTINDAKTWHYYAIIYYKIGFYPEFNDLDPNALRESLDAIKRVGELDKNYLNDNYAELTQYVESIAGMYINEGNSAIENKDFVKASDSYKNAYDAYVINGRKDVNILVYAARFANSAEKYDTAIEYCESILKDGLETPETYSVLANAYSGLKNNDKALELVAVGREKFPDNDNLINEQISLYLVAGRAAEVLDQVKLMAQKFPDNTSYPFILGTIYGDSQSELYNIEEALAQYNRCIEINENFSDAYMNIASLLNNKALEIYQHIDDIPLDKVDEYNAAVEEAKSYDNRALPYVEKAHQLFPDDLAIKQALRSLYLRLKMNDKAAELN